MWPFKQKLNLWKGCLVAHVIKGIAEDPGFEKERVRDALGFISSNSHPGLATLTLGRI